MHKDTLDVPLYDKALDGHVVGLRHKAENLSIAGGSHLVWDFEGYAYTLFNHLQFQSFTSILCVSGGSHAF